ncbi:MAG: FdtA/QdtA family cupin domain-containing protein [Muribaculaceae bacterium]|nr:FdtA/QdtA family cupin domain-containing protein [Muribaculaceae bacterium]MDE6285627.1 FdtA/QdtA family cupin domain-containing protein [Muribaculaceae bacterium]
MPESKTATVHDCGIIELDRHHSRRKGDLSVVESCATVPFDVRRVYYLYDVPGGESRGGHAHRSLWQLIVAAAGSFTVTLDDGRVKRSFTLNRPYQGLLVRPGIWRTITDFSSGAVCLVLASDHYDEKEYIRNYNDFKLYRSSVENE